ncbi:hypothetical protein ACIF80_21905 [Streptomyces sp. NPDC085927]|uniref:hypothetical protein n=1 Tax=Streptomyces sp. NPDC085927 TaxID=3365738 RepID=UPI0037D61E32
MVAHPVPDLVADPGGAGQDPGGLEGLGRRDGSLFVSDVDPGWANGVPPATDVAGGGAHGRTETTGSGSA